MKNSKSFSTAALTVILSLTALAMGQSGRRNSKTASPPPQPSTESTSAPPAPSPTPRAPKPRVVLEAGMELADAFTGISVPNYYAVYESFMNRLRRSPSVEVIDDGVNFSRGDAAQKAKAAKEEKVVWLRLGLDNIGQDPLARADIRNVFIEYVILAPKTAKVFKQGRTYPQTHQGRVGIPTTRVPTGDYYYNRAAEEAAERVLSALDLPTRPVPGH